MENQFVPYKLAVKLKELGFVFEYLSIWAVNYPHGKTWLKNTNKLETIDDVPAPLWQQAFDWFRENHNLYIIIIPTINMYWTFKTMTVIEGMVEVPPYDHVDANDYSTYEEAREACLEKLIEIVENKNVKQ